MKLTFEQEYLGKALINLTKQQLLCFVKDSGKKLLRNMLKKNIVYFLIQKMESFETGKEYLKSLGKNHYEIISAICQFSELPHFDFIEMFGEGILIKDRQYSYTNRTIYKVSKEYSYLKVNDKSVFITQSLQKEFQKYVDKHKDATLKNSEHPKTTNTFSNENDAFEFLGIISDFYNNKVVKLTAAKKFKKKDSLQILNSISLQKIFPDDKDKNSEVFIQFLNAVVAGLSFKVNKISDLQQIYENFLSENYIILKFMNIPGSYYRKNWYAERASDGYFEAVYEMLRNFPLNFWVSIKNIKTYFKLNNFSESFSQALGFDNYYFINSSFLTSYRSEEISREIDDSIIKSIFGYLSILGLFEIAYNKPEGVSKTTMQNKQYLSVFDGLQSVKMTELGEYILGFRDSYEVKKKTENICKFTFSKYELKVSLSTKSPRDEVFFKAISHTSSDLTYWISFKSIIKNSEDKKHLLQILKTFEKYFDKNTPQIWTDFINTIRLRISPISRNDNEVVLTLKKDNNLMRIFSEDVRIKKIIRKAEGLSVIIKLKDIKKLKNLLAEYGYFV